MAEGMRANGHATGSEIHPLLRQRMLNRASTLSEGVQPSRPLDHRRSSLFSDISSDTRPYSRSGAKDAETSLEEPTLWYSAPLVFAILPAIGGLLFKNGNGFVTDILLLGVGGIFLNWCLRAPWYEQSICVLVIC